MANIEIATFEQIATVLSQLMTNYNALADNYYNIFYSTTPADITIKLYDSEGNLVSYTIPNRAKDFNYIKNGVGAPENNVPASVGTIYQDTTNGVLYIKQVGTGRTGWVAIPTDTGIEEGSGSPEGVLTRPKGAIYVDKDSATMYIKTTSVGNTGWSKIAISVSEIQTELNQKMDVDGRNATCSICVESYKNGNSWYRVYSDGWCEQGGVTNTVYANVPSSISYLKTFIDTNYSLLVSLVGEYVNSSYPDSCITSKATSTFSLTSGYSGGATFCWVAKGFIS